jgi:hypothetical protein
MQTMGIGSQAAAQPQFQLNASEPPRSITTNAFTTTLNGINIVDRIWRRAVTHSQLTRKFLQSPSTTVLPDPFIQAERLQHEATDMMETTVLKCMLHYANPFRKALMTAVAAPNASTFLTVLPTEPLYRLDDESMRLAIRHRLGLPPSDSLPSQHCVCTRSDFVFSSDPDHLHSCNLTRTNSLTLRHDQLVHTIAELSREAGWHATREPMNHLRPLDPAAAAAVAASVDPADPDDLDNCNLPAHWNRHGDLLLLRHDKKLYIDVAVTRPTNSSNLAYNPKVTTDTLHSTHRVASRKHAKYDAIAKLNEYDMLPFVLESYGGLGPEAIRVINFLAASSSDLDEKEFRKHALRRIAICLQRGNAHIGLLGQQQMHIRRQVINSRNIDSAFRHNARSLTTQITGTALRHRLDPWLSASDAAGADAAAAEVESAESGTVGLSAAFVHRRVAGCADAAASA